MTGIIFAMEGIRNTLVILNGPSGCKFYHSSTCDARMIRKMEFNPLEYPELWYFGQPEVPCTYLDKKDYVYGSQDKLEEILYFAKNNLDFKLIVIVNSPGAALIGDDLNRIVSNSIPDKNFLVFESPGYSKPIWEGYSHGAIKLLDLIFHKNKPRNCSKKSVNLIGLSIFHKNFRGDVQELERLFNLIGVEVNCALCAGASFEEISRFYDADLNVVIDSVYGLEIAKHLKENFGMDYWYCDELPIGFDATDLMMREVAEKLGCDLGRYKRDCELARADCFFYISRVNALTGLPKGTTVGISGTSIQCLSYGHFLKNYLGMNIKSMNIIDGKLRERVPEFDEAVKNNIFKTENQIILGDGNLIGKLKSRNFRFQGIEISLPSQGYIDVVPKTHLGIKGAMQLIEEIINKLPY